MPNLEKHEFAPTLSEGVDVRLRKVPLTKLWTADQLRGWSSLFGTTPGVP